MNDGP